MPHLSSLVAFPENTIPIFKCVCGAPDFSVSFKMFVFPTPNRYSCKNFKYPCIWSKSISLSLWEYPFLHFRGESSLPTMYRPPPTGKVLLGDRPNLGHISAGQIWGKIVTRGGAFPPSPIFYQRCAVSPPPAGHISLSLPGRAVLRPTTY